MELDKGKQLASWIVEEGRKEGAETVSVALYRSEEFEVTWRKGEVELLSEAGSSYLEAEVSRNRSTASVHTCDLGEESVSSMLEEGVALAGHTDRDEFFSLPDEAELGSADAELKLHDPQVAKVPADEKVKLAREMEDAALARDSRIIPDQSQVSTSLLTVVRANSLGFCHGYRKTLAGLSLSCAVKDRGSGENVGKKQSDHWFSSAVHWADLESPSAVAEKAVDRVLRKLGAVKPKTQAVPVIFDPLTAATLLSSLASASSGSRIYQKLSYLTERLGKRVGSEQVTVVDDPLLPGRPGSRPFDAEGVRSRRNVLVRRGILNTFLLSTYSANKLGRKTTGSRGGLSNLYLEAGTSDPAEIISSVDNGLYVTYLSGQGADVVTGDYSRGAQGLWIENGRLSYPVNELTIAGTFDDIFNGIEMVGNDLVFNRSVVSPTIKVEKMTVSGS